MAARTNEIDRLAAQWVARLDAAEPSAELKKTLEAWLAQDSRHLGAYIRTRAVMVLFDRLAPALKRSLR